MRTVQNITSKRLRAFFRSQTLFSVQTDFRHCRRTQIVNV